MQTYVTLCNSCKVWRFIQFVLGAAAVHEVQSKELAEVANALEH